MLLYKKNTVRCAMFHNFSLNYPGLSYCFSFMASNDTNPEILVPRTPILQYLDQIAGYLYREVSQ